jgi:hypothetical protein
MTNGAVKPDARRRESHASSFRTTAGAGLAAPSIPTAETVRSGGSAHVGKDELGRRILMAGVLLPELTETARKIHARAPWLIEAAVLGAWANLAGANGWTAAMVRAVKRQLAESEST